MGIPEAPRLPTWSEKIFGLPKRFWGKDEPPKSPDVPRDDAGTTHVGFRTWIPVTSSNLRAIWYDPETETLKIEFFPESGGGVRWYAYSNVPMRVFVDLLNAPSKGKYHAKHIKWNYVYTQLGYGGN